MAVYKECIMLWFVAIIILAALLILAVLRASDTKKMSPEDQKKLRQLQQEIQRIGSPDPKDFPW